MQLWLKAKAAAVPLHIWGFHNKTSLPGQNVIQLRTNHSPPPAAFTSVTPMLEIEALVTEQSSCQQRMGWNRNWNSLEIDDTSWRELTISIRQRICLLCFCLYLLVPRGTKNLQVMALLGSALLRSPSTPPGNAKPQKLQPETLVYRSLSRY